MPEETKGGFVAYLKEKPIYALNAALFILVVSSYLTQAVGSFEVYLHLTFGRWIRAHSSLPTTDLWTQLGAGSPWRDSSWLFDYLLACFDSAWPTNGLILLKLTFVTVFVSAMCYGFTRVSKSLFFGSLLAAFVSSGIFVGTSMEPFVLGWALFVVLLALCRALAKNFTLVRLLILFFLALLYVNIHASYYFAVIVGLMFVLERSLGVKEKLLIAAALLLPCVLNPYFGAQIPGVFIEFVSGIQQAVVFRNEVSTIYDYPFAFLLLLWVLFLSIWQFRGGILSSVEYLLLVVASIAALAALSYVPYAVIAVGWSTARIWGAGNDGSGSCANVVVGVKKLQESFEKLPALGVVWVLVCLIIVNSWRLMRFPVINAALPVKAVDFILDNELPGPVLHKRSVGSYLIYRFSNDWGDPERLAIFDSRNVVLRRNLAIAEKGYNSLKPNWTDLLEDFKPQTILVSNEEPVFHALNEMDGWPRVYIDSDLELNVGAAKKPEYRRYLQWAVFSKKAAAEPEIEQIIEPEGG